GIDGIARVTPNAFVLFLVHWCEGARTPHFLGVHRPVMRAPARRIALQRINSTRQRSEATPTVRSRAAAALDRRPNTKPAAWCQRAPLLTLNGRRDLETIGMEFRKILALRGPNIWAKFPVLEAWVDLGALKDSPSDVLPGFNERLMAWLPTMIEHRCSVGTRGGYFERLRRGTYQGHVLEHVCLELQALAGTDVGFGRTRETSEEGVYKVAVEYEYEGLGRAALEAARRLCLAAVHDTPFDVAAEVEKLRELAGRLRPDPDTAALL